MRPGLVVGGAGLLVLGGLLVVATLSTPGVSAHSTTRIIDLTVPAHGDASVDIWGDNGSASSVAIAWRSPTPISAQLLSASGCGVTPAPCDGPVTTSWTGVASGAWSVGASAGAHWRLDLNDSSGDAVSVSLLVTSSVPTSPPSPTWAIGVELASAVLLGAIGGVAVFLGLFLRAGVYQRPPAPPTGPGPGH